MTTAAVLPDPEVEPTISVDQVASALGVSRATAYEAVRTGSIPSIRIGKRYVIPTAGVRRLLQLDPPSVPPAA